MTPPDIKQASEFVYEQLGWVHHPDHKIIGGHSYAYTNPAGKGKDFLPPIARAMIRELLEEVKDGKRVRDADNFSNALMDVIGPIPWWDTPYGKAPTPTGVIKIAICEDPDLIMAFCLAYGGE